MNLLNEETQKYFESIITHINAPLFICKEDGEICFNNDLSNYNILSDSLNLYNLCNSKDSLESLNQLRNKKINYCIIKGLYPSKQNIHLKISLINFKNSDYFLCTIIDLYNSQDKQIENIIDSLSEPAIIITNNKIQYFNESLSEFFKVSAEDLYLSDINNFIYNDDSYLDFDKSYHFISTKNNNHTVKKDFINIKYKGENSNILIFRDISKQKSLETEVLEQRLFFEAIKNTDSIIAFIHQGEKFIMVNKALVDLLGYTEQELLNMDLWQLVHPEHRSIAKERAIKRLNKSEVPNRYEIKILKKNGETGWIDFSAGVITWRGEPTILGTAFEITERKRIEAEKVDNEKQLRDILDNIPEAIIIQYKEKILYFNKSALKVFEAEEKDADDFNIMDVIPEEYKEEARINLRNLYESKEKNIINEYKFYTLTGKLIDIEISSVLFDFQGKKTILSVIRDVTKRNKIRNELLEKDKALQAIVDLTPSLLLIHQDSKFVMINKAFEKISGYSKEEILGRHYWEFVHPDQREKVKKLGQARLYGVKVPDRYEMKVVRKNGEIAWLDFSARTISWNGKPATLGTAFDITEIKSIQKELKLSEERFRKLFEHNLVVQLIINIDTFQIEDASPAAAKFYGYELEELKGMMYYEISMTEVAELKRRLEQVWNNERNHWIVKHKNSNGDVLDIELYSSPIEMQGDRIIYTLIFDISEKLMIEQQYLHSQKMESVGKLAGGVAHDFNNMLSVILNYALLSLNELDQDSIVYKYVKEIYSAGEKSAQLTSQLLGYARKQTILPEILNINSVINDIMQMIRRLLREDIDIVWNLNEDLWYVKLDVSQLHQIIMNLCVNAGDAIDGAGKIEITTDNVKLEDIKNIHEPLENIKHDKFVKLSVKDNGSGISKKDLKHIFEPFFTTKLSGEGTGLGLATIYGIVKQNDGFITVDSELGIGAEFSIYFPQTDEIIKKIKEEDTSYSTKNHKTILITEDEESILKVTKMILEDCGHKIITSTSPLRSLELAKEYKEIDLLITDVIMPEINGYELAKSIKDICPDIKILFMSGYSEDILTNDGVLEKEINFIQKPYNASDLYNKINKIFDDD